MSAFLHRIRQLVSDSKVRISEHGYDELAADGIRIRDVFEGLADAKTVEEYLEYPKGPCILVLETGSDGRPIHVVWGIPHGSDEPAVLVTAYRPGPDRWTEDLMRRK